MEIDNIDTGFLYKNGTYGEIGRAKVIPSLPAMAGTTAIDDVVPRFFISSGAFKTRLSESSDIGIWYTTLGNGAKIDWSPVTNPIFADVDIPTLTGIIKYNLNENISILGGIKRVTINKDSSLQLPLTPIPFAQYNTVDYISDTGLV